MQTFDRLARRASAFACCVSILALLTACSISDSGSSNATSTTGASGGAGPSNTIGSDTSATSNDVTTSSGGSSASGTGGSSAGGTGGSASATNDTSNSSMGTASGGAAGADQGCSMDVASHDLDAGIHVTECSSIDYSTNPPSSGEHYDVWAFYQTYDFPVPRGYWVHSLEHGAVVISYNCADGCPDEVAEVEAFIDSLPIDPRCVPYGVDRQVILTPDPLLDTRWAMSSWGHTLRAECIDQEAFRDFYESNVAKGPEDICGGGSALTEAALAPNCGE